MASSKKVQKTLKKTASMKGKTPKARFSPKGILAKLAKNQGPLGLPPVGQGLPPAMPIPPPQSGMAGIPMNPTPSPQPPAMV